MGDFTGAISPKQAEIHGLRAFFFWLLKKKRQKIEDVHPLKRLQVAGSIWLFSGFLSTLPATWGDVCVFLIEIDV